LILLNLTGLNLAGRAKSEGRLKWSLSKVKLSKVKLSKIKQSKVKKSKVKPPKPRTMQTQGYLNVGLFKRKTV